MMFEAGERWHYGHFLHWLQLFIERATGQKFVPYRHKHIFDPLGMQCSTYRSEDREDIHSRLLQMVQQEKNRSLVPAPDAIGGSFQGSLDGSDIPELQSSEEREY
jgi:CubicO group peptidase (beta-lactamase class C family)